MPSLTTTFHTQDPPTPRCPKASYTSCQTADEPSVTLFYSQKGQKSRFLFQKILKIDSKKFKLPFTFERHRNRTKIQQQELHPLEVTLMNKKLISNTYRNQRSSPEN